MCHEYDIFLLLPSLSLSFLTSFFPSLSFLDIQERGVILFRRIVSLRPSAFLSFYRSFLAFSFSFCGDIRTQYVDSSFTSSLD